MNADEKKQVLDYILSVIPEEEDNYTKGVIDAYNKIYEYISCEIKEVNKESNLEHYHDKIIELGGFRNFAVRNNEIQSCVNNLGGDCDNCIFSKSFQKHDSDELCDRLCEDKKFEWLHQRYNEHKLTQFEYDLLITNNMAKGKRLKDFDIYENLQEVGYFKNLDFNLKIEDILDNCEVVKDKE